MQTTVAGDRQLVVAANDQHSAGVEDDHDDSETSHHADGGRQQRVNITTTTTGAHRNFGRAAAQTVIYVREELRETTTFRQGEGQQ